MGDNSVSMRIDYTPFGDNPTGASAKIGTGYTGMNYEPESATYDYHARDYDPGTTRFTSPSLSQTLDPQMLALYMSDIPTSQASVSTSHTPVSQTNQTEPIFLPSQRRFVNPEILSIFDEFGM